MYLSWMLRTNFEMTGGINQFQKKQNLYVDNIRGCRE